MINNIPTQALLVYPKPLSPSENTIANMAKSYKFILAQTRKIQFKLKIADTLQIYPIYCTAMLVTSLHNLYHHPSLPLQARACRCHFHCPEGKEFTHPGSHTNYCSSYVLYFCIFCAEILSLLGLWKAWLVLSFTGISNQMKEWRHSRDPSIAVAKERSYYEVKPTKQQNIRDKKIIHRWERWQNPHHE